MKALIFVIALVSALLIGCESNVTGPANEPAISQPTTKTLPISGIIEPVDENNVKHVIEVVGVVEYSILEVKAEAGEPGARTFQVTMTLNANLRDKGTDPRDQGSGETWKVVGSSTERLTFVPSMRCCFAKKYAVERMIQNSKLGVEYEIVNNNLAASQIFLTL